MRDEARVQHASEKRKDFEERQADKRRRKDERREERKRKAEEEADDSERVARGVEEGVQSAAEGHGRDRPSQPLERYQAHHTGRSKVRTFAHIMNVCFCSYNECLFLRFKCLFSA